MRHSLVLLGLVFSFLLQGQNLHQMPQNVKRSSISSFENFNGVSNNGGKVNKGAKGHAFEEFKAGETKILLDLKGPGIIQRMWFTVRDRSPEMLRAMRLRMYWDGQSKPAVDVPFGDFFGFGLAKVVRMETALFANPEGRSFNCFISMPFKTGAKITITNESELANEMIFYDIDFVELKKPEPDALYFHAFWTRQKSSELGKDFEFLPRIEGKGRYLGLNMGIKTDACYENTGWCEGEVKLYMDGDAQYPSYIGTGTEDYIGTAWGLGVYHNLYQGCTLANDSTREYAFYRFHVPDQVFFFQHFSGAIQQMGGEMRDYVRRLIKNKAPLKPIMVLAGDKTIRLLDQPKDIFDADFPDGWVNFYRRDDYSSTAYFYLDRPSTSLPELQGVKERIN